KGLPDKLAPDERARLQLRPVGFVIAGLKRFRVPTRSRLYLLRGLRLMPDTAARTIFQHRERLFRMGRMEPVSPAAHIGKHTVIPAEITVKAHQTALLRL